MRARGHILCLIATGEKGACTLGVGNRGFENSVDHWLILGIDGRRSLSFPADESTRGGGCMVKKVSCDVCFGRVVHARTCRDTSILLGICANDMECKHLGKPASVPTVDG